MWFGCFFRKENNDFFLIIKNNSGENIDNIRIIISNKSIINHFNYFVNSYILHSSYPGVSDCFHVCVYSENFEYIKQFMKTHDFFNLRNLYVTKIEENIENNINRPINMRDTEERKIKIFSTKNLEIMNSKVF